MGHAVSLLVTLETEECCTCGVIFAIPSSMQNQLRGNGGKFFCPNGHCQSYSKTEADRLREKLDEQTKAATRMADRAYKAEAAEQKALNDIARLKKRASAGMCPCCNRTFQQLARHMKMKHPGV